MSTPAKNLPKLRRVVTTHDEAGVAKVWIDAEIENKAPPHITDGATFGLAWGTDSSPADCQTPADGSKLPIGELASANGSVVRYVDMPPELLCNTHRTLSIDYGFVLCGTVELWLPDGSKTPIYPGEIVVQRGTDHQWKNPSKTEWARMVYVLLPSKPIIINGESLPPKTIH